jgi:beta-galactosidase/beta-glucuronidase
VGRRCTSARRHLSIAIWCLAAEPEEHKCTKDIQDLRSSCLCPRTIIARSVVRTPGEHVALGRLTRGCMEGARGLEVEVLEVMQALGEREASVV